MPDLAHLEPTHTDIVHALLQRWPEHRIAPSLGRITISAGGKQAIFHALLATLDPGDEVLIPAPWWVSYPEIVRFAGAEVVALPTEAAGGFRIDAAQLPEPPTALVANLPYNVAVPVVLHALETFPSLRKGLVMVQSEVADRLTAGPGSKIYGGPSVKMAWYASAKRAGSVSPKVFWPVPNVASGLVAFERIASPEANRREVFTAVDAAFGQRRPLARIAAQRPPVSSSS